MIRWRRGEDIGEAGVDLIRWWYVPAGAVQASVYEYVDGPEIVKGKPIAGRFGWAVELRNDPGCELLAGYVDSREEAKAVALEETEILLTRSLARLR